MSKGTGVPLARLAALAMTGRRIAELDVPERPTVAGVAVKEAAFPLGCFDVDVLLGPEMRSTAEVMGMARLLTTMSATSAACDALIALKSLVRDVRSMQDRIAAVQREGGGGAVAAPLRPQLSRIRLGCCRLA